jgi:hypothetical protein
MHVGGWGMAPSGECASPFYTSIPPSIQPDLASLSPHTRLDLAYIPPSIQPDLGPKPLPAHLCVRQHQQAVLDDQAGREGQVEEQGRGREGGVGRTAGVQGGNEGHDLMLRPA